MIPAVYSVIPRGRSPEDYLATADDVMRWTAEESLDGTLFFAGAGAHLDPWISAVSFIARASCVTPMIAVNPVYAHPVAAAKYIASIGSLYQRRVALNFIAGTSLAEMSSVGDGLDHAARYRRLGEYAQIVSRLLSSRRPLDFEGEFYRIAKVQVLPQLRDELRPLFFLAGKSPAARQVGADIGASMIGMLTPPGEPVDQACSAVHFGVVTRPEQNAAWARARECFPDDPIGAAVQRSSMADTDANWKASLMGGPEQAADSYWTGPFRNGHADCPYVIADYAGLAALLAALGAAGVRTVLIDVPSSKDEFRHLAAALSVARSLEREDSDGMV